MQCLVTFAHIPHALIEALETGMQMIRAVVTRKLVFNTVQRKATTRYAAGMTPDQCAEITCIANVFVERCKAEHDLAEVAVAIRCFQCCERDAVVRNSDFKPVTVGERVSK